MCRKSVYLISFVLVLSLISTSSGQPVDPNLVGWWKFDEASGTTVADSSGSAHNGTLNGNPQWVSGYFGGALEFDGSGDYVEISYSSKLALKEFTVSAWVNIATEPGLFGILGTRSGGEYTFDFKVQVTNVHGDIGNGTAWLNTTIDIGSGDIGTTGVGGDLALDTWYMIAYVIDNTHQNVRLYLDGDLKQTIGISGTPLLMQSGESMRIGHTGTSTEWMNGLIDDVRIYNRALSTAEIKKLVPPKLKAYKPNPANGLQGVTMGLLTWTAGDTAALHDVYFGTNLTPGPAEYKPPRGYYAFYYHAAGLTAGTTYYWRIDEVEGDGVTIHTGDVWSFTAAPSTAYNTSPCDGMKWVDVDADLSWKAGMTAPGMTAAKHDVYFGTNQADVAGGTGGTFKVEQYTLTYEPGTLAQNTTYYWRIDEIDNAGTKYPGAVWSLTTIGPLPSGAGLKGEYYHWSGSSPPPREEAFRTLVMTRIDPVVDFPWGDPGSPDPRVSVDLFSARWTGEIDIPTTGAYTFTTSTDDGVRLWVNNQPIIENWTEHGTTTDTSKPIELAAGRYPIQMEYYENGGGAVARLFWASPCIPSQIIPAAALSPPVRASAPRPPDGATDVKQTPVLRWDAGYKGAKHNVYLGTDADAVANATTASAGIYRGQQDLAANSYVPTEAPLAWNSTYYWRIDEVNAADTWKGSVWSFTTANFLVVDDFEDYTDDVGGRIFQTWKDGLGWTQPAPGYLGNGTGSSVGNSAPPYAEQTIVHGGVQSMPLGYDNTGLAGKARYSETFREWASPQDWTVNNLKALTLWFYGVLTNDAAQLYVALEDNAGHIKVVNHPDPETVQKAGWREWNIELTQFSAAGVNLKAIKKMYIGLGNRTSPTVGGTGKIYIDDITVYPSRYVPSMPKPAADLSGNGVVDQADVDILANLWLDTGFQVTPADPGTTGLVAYYPFNGNANDTVGGHNGTIVGTPTYAAGKIGQAIQLNGVDQMVDVGAVGISGVAPRTIAGWARANALVDALPNWINIFGFTGPSGNNGHFDIEVVEALAVRGYGIHVYGWERRIMPIDFEWHHLAASYDGTTIKWYGDGSLIGSDSSRVLATPNNIHMGMRDDNTNYWPGRVDEVRIYSRALSDAQVAWLAGLTSMFSIPADLHQDNVINFKDFAVLADSWLEELLWP